MKQQTAFWFDNIVLKEAVMRRITPTFLKEKLEHLTTNNWVTCAVEPRRKIFLLASDATETRIVGVYLSEQGNPIAHFSKSLNLTHIYIKECQAIDAVVRWMQKRRGDNTPAEFRIAVDNKAAAAAAQFCYSSNESVNKLYYSLWKFIE